MMMMGRQRPLTEEMIRFGRQTSHYLLAIMKQQMDHLKMLCEQSKPRINYVCKKQE